MRENLKIAMVRENVTSAMLADLLGVHRDTVANKLSGETSFYVDEANKVWQALFRQYDFQWLFARLEESA